MGCVSVSIRVPQPSPSASGSHGLAVPLRGHRWHPGKPLCFPCWFLPDASRRACFIFLLNKLVTPFGFSHISQHIKTCLRALENVPMGPRPSGKTFIWTAAGGGTKDFLWNPSVGGGNLPKWPLKRIGEGSYDEPDSVTKMDSFTRSWEWSC